MANKESLAQQLISHSNPNGKDRIEVVSNSGFYSSNIKQYIKDVNSILKLKNPLFYDFETIQKINAQNNYFPDIEFPLKYTIKNNTHTQDDIKGLVIDTDDNGRVTKNGFCEFSKLIQRYSDKSHESSRFVFVNRDGEIVRHEVFSSKSVNATGLVDNKEQLHEMKEYSEKNNLRLIFVHNHPSGHVKPSDDDIDITKDLETLFGSNFSGHVILDHGTFGLYSSGNGWNILKNGKLISLVDYERFISENWAPDELRSGIIENDMEYKRAILVARKVDDVNTWNKKDFVPVSFVTSTNRLVKTVFIHNLEFNNQKAVEEKLKDSARKCGAVSCLMFANDDNQLFLCRKFNGTANIAKSVCKAPDTDGKILTYRYESASVFNGEDSKARKVEAKTLYEEFKFEEERKDVGKRIAEFFDFDTNSALKNKFEYFKEKFEKEGNPGDNPLLLAVASTILECGGFPALTKEDLSKSFKLPAGELARLTRLGFAARDAAEQIVNKTDYPLMTDGSESIEIRNFDDFYTYINSNPNRARPAVGGWFENPEIKTKNGDKKMENGQENTVLEKSEREEKKRDFILEKLSTAGIEIVTDKEEFERILENQIILQKMTEENKVEDLFVSENDENLNSEIDKLTINDVNVYNKYINITKETPFILKEFGLENYPVNIYKQKLARALFLEKEKYGERLTHGHKGEFTEKEVKEVFKNISNPRYIFYSKQDITNPEHFYLIGVYDVFDNMGNPMMLSFHYDKNRKEVEANWITAVYGKNLNVLVNDWVRKGFLKYKNDLEIKNASEEVVALYMRVSNLQKHHNDIVKQKSDYVNDNGVFFYKQNNQTYGFTYEDKIYLNPEIMNSNVVLHEYTHLWDAYTRRTNPELWQKGKDIFKNTRFWDDVKNDPNYADIADNDDLLLSEVHAQICGKMADAVLNRILERDGELTKGSVIDWDKETWNYICEEMVENKSVNYENGLTLKDLSVFLSMPMKDLWESKQITQEISRENNESDRGNNAEIENKEPVVKDLSKVLVIDTETTGFSAEKDELLQVSIIDGTGKTLFNSLIKPDHNTEWKGAMIKNHISPRMVADKPSIKDVASEIQKILDSADMYVSYNGRFDVNFLEAAGIVLKNKPHLDVIKPAASVTKIPERENDRRAVDGYHYPKLEEAAKAIGYGFKAHNALNDTKATLEVAKSIYGENLEKLTEEDLARYTIDEKKASKNKNKEKNTDKVEDPSMDKDRPEETPDMIEEEYIRMMQGEGGDSQKKEKSSETKEENISEENSKEVPSEITNMSFLEIAASCKTVDEYKKFYDEYYNFKGSASIRTTKPESANRCAVYDNSDDALISPLFDDNPENRKKHAEAFQKYGYEFFIPSPENVQKEGLNTIKKAGERLCNLMQQDILPAFKIEKQQVQKQGDWHFDRHRIEQIDSPVLRTRALAILDELETADYSDTIENPLRVGAVMPPFGVSRENEDGTIEMDEMKGYVVQGWKEEQSVTLVKGDKTFVMEWTAFQDRINGLKELFNELQKNNTRSNHLEAIYRYQDTARADKDEIRAAMASQFFHNFSVLCRGKWTPAKGKDGNGKDIVYDNLEMKEMNGAKNFEDAVSIARFLYSKLPEEEQKKLKIIEKQYKQRTGKPFEELLKEKYSSFKRQSMAYKGNEKDDKSYDEKNWGIAEQIRVNEYYSGGYIPNKGKIDKDLEIRVGDEVEVGIIAKSWKNKLRQLPLTGCRILSASKNKNEIVLFDEKKNARYTMPLDTFIEGKKRAIEHDKKIEKIKNSKLLSQFSKNAKVQKEEKKARKDMFKYGIDGR